MNLKLMHKMGKVLVMGSGIYLGLEQKKMVYGKEKAVEKDTGDVRGKVEIYSVCINVYRSCK